MIDAVTGAGEVTRQQEPRLYNILENLCISRGIAMPTLRVAEDPALNAFSTGLTRKAIFDHGDARADERAQRRRDWNPCSAMS